MWHVSDKLDTSIYPQNYTVQNGLESEKEAEHRGHGTVTEPWGQNPSLNSDLDFLSIYVYLSESSLASIWV